MSQAPNSSSRPIDAESGVLLRPAWLHPVHEPAEPEDVLDVINAYDGVVGQQLHAHDGTVGDFAGDGIMAYSMTRCPATRRLAAVDMALAVREQMPRTRHRMAQPWLRPRLRDRISYGYATLGIIGFEGRDDYSPTRFRRQPRRAFARQADPNRSSSTERVREAVAPSCEINAVGEVTLKGFQTPVTVSEVLAPRPAQRLQLTERRIAVLPLCARKITLDRASICAR